MSRKFLLISLLLLALIGCNRDPEAAKQKLVDTGNKYFENGKFKEASIIYRRAIQKDRRYGEAYYRLGMAEQRLGRVRQSMSAFTRAVELQPENEDAYSKLADLYLAIYLNNPKGSEQWLEELQNLTEKAEQYFPGSFHVNRVQGFVALTGRDYEAAIKLFRTALEQQPEDQRVNLGLVQALAASGQVEESMTLAKENLARDKSFGAMYDALYALHLSSRNFDEALATLQEKVDSNPDNIGFRLQLARHYLMTRKPVEMKATLAEITAGYERFPSAFRDVSTFYGRIRQYDEALDVLRQGVEILPDQAVDLQNRIVDILANQGKREEAFRLVEEILKKDSDNATTLALRGALRLSSGDRAELDAAVADFESVLARMPDNAVLRHNLAEAYRAQGNVDRAIVEYQEAIKKRRDYLPPRYSLASVYLAQREYAKAVATAEEILEIRPDDLQAKLVRTNAWTMMGERGQARSALEEMIKANPQSRETTYHLARLDLIEERYAQAEQLFRRIYEGTPPDMRGLLGLADVYMAQGRPQEAVNLLRTRVEEDAENTGLRLALGRVLSTTGQHDSAVEELKKVLEKRPDDSLTTRILGETLFRAKRLTEAEEYLSRASELNPSDADAQLYLGMLAELDGAMQEATAYYERVLELAPDNVVALNNLSYILAETTADLDRAFTLAQRARGLVPDDPNIADTLGWVYIKKNVPESAVPILTDVVDKNPKIVIWRYHLAMALFQRGEMDRARQELQTALTHQPSAEEKVKIQELLVRVGS